LALRSVDRSVEEVLLPTLEEILRRYGAESAVWAFASHWAGDWLRRAIRLAPPPVRPISIVIGDATRDELDVVVAGSHLDDDTIARWAYAIRLAAGAMPIATYRRTGPRVRMRTTGTGILPIGASDAQRRIVEMAENERRLPVADPSRVRSAPRSASL